MKRTLLSLSVMLFGLTVSQAQTTVFYSEDFETFPPDGLTMVFGTIGEGTPGCGDINVGDASEFNSSNVDFLSSVNPTSFLGVNGEPCGGYYTGTVVSDAMDLSGVSELYFKGRYIRTSFFGYGGQFSVTFSNGTDNVAYNTSTDFTVQDAWTSFVIPLPSEYITDGVTFSLDFVAGDGAVVDDLEISDDPGLVTSTSSQEAAEAFAVYPTLVENKLTIESKTGMSIANIAILDMHGETIMEGTSQTMDLSWAPSGMYLVKVNTTTGGAYTYRVIKK